MRLCLHLCRRSYSMAKYLSANTKSGNTTVKCQLKFPCQEPCGCTCQACLPHKRSIMRPWHSYGSNKIEHKKLFVLPAQRPPYTPRLKRAGRPGPPRALPAGRSKDRWGLACRAPAYAPMTRVTSAARLAAGSGLVASEAKVVR